MPYTINKAVVAGRLTKDPAITLTTGEKPATIAKFRIASDRGFGENSTSFVDGFAIGAQADFVKNYLKKGSPIAVVGYLRNNNFEKDGVKKYRSEVVAQAVSSETDGNLNMNSITEFGRLAADPEIRETENGKIANFRIAVPKSYEAKNKKAEKDKDDDADFFRVTAFGKTAEFVEKYLKKGEPVGLEGYIKTGSYDRDGKKVYTFELVAEKLTFATSKKAKEARQAAQTQEQTYSQQPQQFGQSQQAPAQPQYPQQNGWAQGGQFGQPQPQQYAQQQYMQPQQTPAQPQYPQQNGWTQGGQYVQPQQPPADAQKPVQEEPIFDVDDIDDMPLE